MYKRQVQSRAFRQLNRHAQNALVFARNERSRNDLQELPAADGDSDKNRSRKPAMAKIKGHTLDVVQLEALKAVVKEPEDFERIACLLYTYQT